MRNSEFPESCYISPLPDFFSTFTSTNEFAFEEGHQVLTGSEDGGWIWRGHFGRVISDTLYNLVVNWKERGPPFIGVKHLYKNPYWIITSRKAKRWHSSKDCAPEIQGCKKVLGHLSPAFAKKPTPTLQMGVIEWAYGHTISIWAWWLWVVIHRQTSPRNIKCWWVQRYSQITSHIDLWIYWLGTSVSSLCRLRFPLQICSKAAWISCKHHGK